MQQPLTRSAKPMMHHAHAEPITKVETDDPNVGWKVVACIVAGYFTVISIIATGMLTVHALAILFGAYNRQTGW